jgi:Flp pilus assembly protein TadD
VRGSDREFLELLGYLYLQYGKVDAARTVYAVLVELSARRPILSLTYAYCLARTGQYAVALHHLDELGNIPFALKERSAYLLLRGNVLWHMGRRDDARLDLEHFLAVERRRAKLQPTRLSLIVRSATERARNARLNHRAATVARTSADGTARRRRRSAGPAYNDDDGFIRRILRFIARKELNRELVGSD